MASKRWRASARSWTTKSGASGRDARARSSNVVVLTAAMEESYRKGRIQNGPVTRTS